MSTENAPDSSIQTSTIEVNENNAVKNTLDTTEEPQQEKIEVTTEDIPVTTENIVTEVNKDLAMGEDNTGVSQEIKEEIKEETKVENSPSLLPSSDSTAEGEKAVDNDKVEKENNDDKEENEEEGEGEEESDKKETKKKGGKRKGKKGKRNSTPKKEGDNSNNTPNNRRRSSRNKNSKDDVENSPAKKQKVEDDEDEEMEEDNKLYCICRKPYDGSFMVACDSCLEWYHPTCIGSTEEKLKKMKKYICDKCKPSSAPDHGSGLPFFFFYFV